MIDKIKRDREQNWEKAKNFIPKENEVIIYDCEDWSIRFKIGNGIDRVCSLKFIDIETIFESRSVVQDETLCLLQ